MSIGKKKDRERKSFCQGIQAKKNIVKELILNEKIDILCMQETQINKNLDHNLLSFPNYCIETESNSSCSRVAIYVNVKINYIRRRDLEGRDSHIIILELVGELNHRIINTTIRIMSVIQKSKTLENCIRAK